MGWLSNFMSTKVAADPAATSTQTTSSDQSKTTQALKDSIASLGYKYADADYANTLMGLGAKVDTSNALWDQKMAGALFGNPADVVATDNPYVSGIQNLSSASYSNIGAGMAYKTLAALANANEWFSSRDANGNLNTPSKFATWLYRPNESGGLDRAGIFHPTDMLNPYRWQNGGADSIEAKVNSTSMGSLQDYIDALKANGIAANIKGVNGYIIPFDRARFVDMNGEGGQTRFNVSRNQVHRDTDANAWLGDLSKGLGLASFAFPALAPFAQGLAIGNGIVNNDPMSAALGVAGASGLTSQLTDNIFGSGSGSLSDAANNYGWSDGASLGTATPNPDIGGFSNGLIDSAALTPGKSGAFTNADGQYVIDLSGDGLPTEGSTPVDTSFNDTTMKVPDTVTQQAGGIPLVTPGDPTGGGLSLGLIGGGAALAAGAAAAAGGGAGSAASSSLGSGVTPHGNPNIPEMGGGQGIHSADTANLAEMGGGQGVGPGTPVPDPLAYAPAAAGVTAADLLTAAQAVQSMTKKAPEPPDAKRLNRFEGDDRNVQKAARYVGAGDMREAGYTGGMIHNARQSRDAASDYLNSKDIANSAIDSYNANVDKWNSDKGNSGLITALKASQSGVQGAADSVTSAANRFTDRNSRLADMSERVAKARATDITPTGPAKSMTTEGDEVFHKKDKEALAGVLEWLKDGPK